MPERKVGIAERDVFVHITDVQRSGLTLAQAKSLSTKYTNIAPADPTLKI